jgi:hypothetical protein
MNMNMNMMMGRSQKVIKGESYFDENLGLERRRRLGGSIGAEPGKTFGSKREVWNGTAAKTTGGLTLDKLGKNKRGHIVSVAKYLQGKQRIGQLAQSPFFGRVQDLAPRTAGKTRARNSPRATKARVNNYVDDIARLGGIGFQPHANAPAAAAFPPMVHLPFPAPMPANPYTFSQPSYPTMY